MAWFEGFGTWQIRFEDLNLHLVKGGQGPALLLLHGYPQSHLIWRHLAPILAQHFTVYCPDLKGYGDSSAPPPTPDSANYSKRQLAAEMMELMRLQGHERFAVMGHDRGARVGYRLALDFPEAVTRLVSLDIVPTGSYWDQADKRFALGTFHWGFLAQGGGMPEKLIAGASDFWLDWIIRHWAGDFSKFPDDVMAEYRRCFRRPEVIAATCADYRAGATLDYEHDKADLRAGRKIECPVYTFWSGTFVDDRADALSIWRQWADDVRGEKVSSGHFIPEEIPERISGAALGFLRG